MFNIFFFCLILDLNIIFIRFPCFVVCFSSIYLYTSVELKYLIEIIYAKDEKNEEICPLYVIYNKVDSIVGLDGA